MSWFKRHGGVIVLLVNFLTLGALYLSATPLLETPDEPSHFSVVRYIAEEGRLPPQHPAPPDSGPVPVIDSGPPVYYAPPLYYVVAAYLISDLDTSGFAQAVIPNPNWDLGWAPTPGVSPENKHIYVHTSDQRPPYAGWATGMLRLRIFSLLLGGVTVLGVYALAVALWPPTAGSGQGRAHDARVLAATALVAFNPAFLFVTIGVTNDALLVPLVTWAVVGMAHLVSARVSRDWPWVSLLGLLLGLAVITKQSALAFLPVAALAVAWGSRLRRRNWPATLARLAWLAVLVACVGGWWYVYNGLTYHDPLGLRPHQAPTPDWSPPLELLLRQLGQALKGYWAIFGWGLILVDPFIYVILALFVLVGLSGCAVLVVRWALRDLEEARDRVVALLGLALLLNLVGLLLWLWRTSAPYGRLLFPTLGPLAMLLVLGWSRWLGDRLARPFSWAVLFAFGAFAAVVPVHYLRPAYAGPVVLEPSSSALVGATTLDAEFDGGLRLLGYRMTSGDAHPGDEVRLTLYWQPATPVASDLSVFVQVAPSDPEQRVAGQDDFLGGSQYPTTVWRAGEIVGQEHFLRLPDDTPAPGLYWFTVGLYQGLGGERLPLRADGASVPSRAVRLGPLRVRDLYVAPPEHAADYRFGSSIRLVGYDLDAPPKGSEESMSIVVTLHWRATAAPAEDWTVFVHLLDGEGRSVTQHDSPPRDGDFPTGAWRDGDNVPDSHRLLLPPGLAPGLYQLQVGLYNPADGARVPAFDGEGVRLTDDAVVLTQIELTDDGIAHGD
jgi:hypothetical protein